MNIIFYDGKCGLCSREINYYKKIAQSDKFRWLDIATDPTPLKPLKISQADGLRRLHGLDSEGHLHVGVDAFLFIAPINIGKAILNTEDVLSSGRPA